MRQLRQELILALDAYCYRLKFQNMVAAGVVGRLRKKAAEYEHDAERVRPAPHRRQTSSLEGRGMSKPTVMMRPSRQEVRAMVRAMNTGELPSEGASYYVRVKKLAELHWEARALARRGGPAMSDVQHTGIREGLAGWHKQQEGLRQGNGAEVLHFQKSVADREKPTKTTKPTTASRMPPICGW